MADYDLVIRGGTVVTAADRVPCDVGIRGDLSELAGARTAEQEECAGQLKPGKFVDAVGGVMDRRMAADSRIVVLGEDVGIDGGVFRATDGLFKEFGEQRVLDTPLAEASIAAARARRRSLCG